MSDVPPRNKKLDNRSIKNLAAIVQKRVDADFGGNATAFAKDAQVSQPQIAQLLKADGGSGVGIVVLIALRRYLGMSIDDMLGLPPLGHRLLPADQLDQLDRLADAVAFRLRSAPREPDVRGALAAGPDKEAEKRRAAEAEKTATTKKLAERLSQKRRKSD